MKKIFICITDTLLSNFNHLSDKDKIEMVCNEMISVTKAVRMAMIPDHGK